MKLPCARWARVDEGKVVGYLLSLRHPDGRSIVLTDDVADPGLKAGDVGTIVHVHRDGEAFEVEFLTLDGHTAALATVSSSQVRPVTGADITHARDR